MSHVRTDELNANLFSNFIHCHYFVSLFFILWFAWKIEWPWIFVFILLLTILLLKTFCALEIRVPFNSRLTRENLILYIFFIIIQIYGCSRFFGDGCCFFFVISCCTKENRPEIVNSLRRMWDENERWKDRQQTEDSIELVRCVYVIRHTNAYWRNWCAQTCELWFPTWIIINRTLLSSTVSDNGKSTHSLHDCTVSIVVFCVYFNAIISLARESWLLLNTINYNCFMTSFIYMLFV